MRRLPVLAALCVGLMTAAARPALADCAGPTIAIESREVARGGALTVTGTAWGDACYDTGPPPPGRGVLGDPISDIAITLRQGSAQWLVATGAADASYRFTVTVTVPADMTPGPAEIIAVWSGGTAYSPNPAVVIATTTPSGAPATVAMFGPTATTSTAPAAATSPATPPERDDPTNVDDDSGTDNTTSVVIGAASGASAFAVLIAARAMRDRRRRR